MNAIKDDIARASKRIGLTESQAEDLWHAFQDIQTNSFKSSFPNALLYIGAIIAFFSMTWFYTAQLKDSHSLLIAVVYALIFFSVGAYFWQVKKLRVPGGVISSLGIITIPLIVYSLQSVMHWYPTPFSDNYNSFYRWMSGDWVPMEICTLTVACLVLYFIRFPFITVPIYLTLSFISMDAIHLLADPKADNWIYYCAASIAIGTLLNILGFALCRKGQKDFGFWSYLFGMALLWMGITGWYIQTEWEHFIYFLFNAAFILLSGIFHRIIFMVFGTLGVIGYVGHLAYRFSDSLMFSYLVAALGFSIILLAALLTHHKKKRQINRSSY